MNMAPRRLAAMFVVVLLALAAGGAWFFRAQEQQLRADVEANLSAIARLKVDQISQWRAERVGDAAVLTEDLLIVKALSRYVASSTDEAAEPILSRFRSLQEHYHYHDVLLVDTSGKLRLSLSDRTIPIQEETVLCVVLALKERRPVLTDLRADLGELPPRISVVAPLFAGNSESAEPVGAILLQSDARQFLYPLIQSWPTPSRSAETLLIRRDGDAALFLNDLRHQPNTAFRLSIPLSKADCPAVLAVLGQQGVMEGKDHRGVDVLAVSKAIPDTPWLMVAKIDKEEALAEWRFRSLLILALMLGFAAAVGTAAGMVWLYHSKARYRTLFQAEAAQRESEEQSYRLLVRNIPAVVYRGYADGGVEFFDDKIEVVTGYSMEDFASGRLKWTDIIHAEDKDSGKRVLLQALRGERGYVREYRIRRRDGQYAWVQERSQIVCVEDGRIDYISGVLFDVTGSKRSEEEKEKLDAQFRQAQKMEAVGRLAGGVAHDFNNMLGVILGYTELALAALKPIDPIHRNLKAVQEAANRSADLTRQLLAFSRKQTIAPRPVDLNQQTKGMERLLGRIIGEDIDLKLELSEGLWPVYMDTAQIDQVLANLTVNSRDAMPEGGKLTVETANTTVDASYCQRHPGFMPGDFVMLAVSDTGCGMDRETLEHVFEPFFTTKPEGKGTGLGLATVYGIVKQNNGFVNIYSEPGHGTTVRVYIPRYVGEETAVPAVAEEDRSWGRGETVLLVEDEARMLELAKAMLERLGYKVLEVPGPGEAIALCERYPGEIHLLLTDMVMPNMNGRELERRIMNMKPGVRTLFMSGYTADAIAHQGVLEKGAHFLQKPFSLDGLARKVREALAGQS